MLRLYRDLLGLRRDLHAGFEVDGSIEGGLVMRRGQYTLLVGFRDGVTLPMPNGSRMHFNTEQSAYAEEANPPQFVEGQAVFAGPAAVMLGS
jgi:hypothetical protein